MKFFKDLIRNLVILIIIGIALFVFFPQIMGQIFQLYGALFGPLAIIIIIVAALPQKKRRRR